ncbi:MAG: 4-(cytidine 5'-diphospho)-2-C-methyl-D-erythritol kinase, partial [Devosiaceae bacterium]|nr:4-(cytidine 5'-diphospho)-2-C-methyl-D-erythritol kinase [Devosiaceae bacterium]
MSKKSHCFDAHQYVKRSGCAHAKINLNLHVSGQRSDGYHQLQSLVVFARIGDQVSIEQAKGQLGDQLSIDGPFAQGLSADENNLVLRALRIFRSKWPDALPRHLSVSLTKNLPVAAGIGGGSADAAAVLNLLKEGAGAKIDQIELAELALELGADVPACLKNTALIMRGIGQSLEPVEFLPEFYLVLINPGAGVSTSEVFSSLARKTNPVMSDLPARFSGVEHFVNWLLTTRNDLFGPACNLVPQIGVLVNELSQIKACLLARMTGSGATVFGLFATEEQDNYAAEQLGRKWPDYWC